MTMEQKVEKPRGVVRYA